MNLADKGIGQVSMDSRELALGDQWGSRLSVLDLFSGLGAYSLGLERTGGFETVALCEINAFCRRNLKQHWPHVETFDDVKELTGERLRAAGIVPDWIVAGWPCQGNSPAGTGLGMDDPRSGLWSEIRRLAGEIRPQGLLLENSSNLLSINGGADFGVVLGDLAALGFDAEWHCLSAAAFDAPHIRDRVWIIATLADHARHGRSREPTSAGTKRERVGPSCQSITSSDPQGQRCNPRRLPERAPAQVSIPGGAHQHGADAHPDRQGLAVRVADTRGLGGSGKAEPRRAAERVGAVPDASSVRRQPRRPKPAGQQGGPIVDRDGPATDAHSLAPVGVAIARAKRVSWEPEPDVVRVVHGAPDRVERVHALGNLNPPIIPESIGRAILTAIYGRAAA